MWFNWKPKTENTCQFCIMVSMKILAQYITMCQMGKKTFPVALKYQQQQWQGCVLSQFLCKHRSKNTNHRQKFWE